MNKFAAAGVFFTVLSVIAFAVLWAGVCDVWLFLNGQWTITDLLRQHPGYLAWAIIVAFVFLVGLAIHLYLWV